MKVGQQSVTDGANAVPRRACVVWQVRRMEVEEVLGMLDLWLIVAGMAEWSRLTCNSAA